MRHWVFVAFAAGAVSGVIALAQQAPPAGTPQFRAATEIVHLDVSVLDTKTRQPVQGLTARS